MSLLYHVNMYLEFLILACTIYILASVQTEVSYLPPYYIAAMPDDVQEEIKQKVIAALTEHGECTPENIENAMCSKIYDLEDLIDIREYVERMEEEQRKKQEQSGRGGR